MKTRQVYYFLGLFIFGLGYSQESQLNRGATDFEQLAYVNVIQTYERIVSRGYKSEEVLSKLGDAYYFRGELPDAAKWYSALYGMNPQMSPERLYRYGQSLRAIENYELSDQIMDQFKAVNANDNRALRFKSNRDYLESIQKNTGRYRVYGLDINTPYSDYGASFYKEQLVFASSRDTGHFAKRKHKWTGESFTDLYVGSIDSQGLVSNVVRFDKQLKSKYHESTPVFTKEGKTVYFTRNNFIKGKRRSNAQGITLLKIYRATLDDKGTWTNIEALPFTSDQYSVAHPALSPDEQYLYFASDMPGTLGGSDLFKVRINADGSFGTPENLGPGINTEGRETFPFISQDNEFYFASDGYPGLGGLDVYAFKIKTDGSYTDPQNVGSDINSPMDDFGYIIATKTNRGFFSSNRAMGEGGDDIYGFIQEVPLDFDSQQSLKGLVLDKDNGEPIAGATVVLFNSEYQELARVQSALDGGFDFGKVAGGQKFRIQAQKQGYLGWEEVFITPDSTGETLVSIAIERIEKPLRVGDDLAKHFGISLIYFDLDRWEIRWDAQVDLAKIVDVMKQHPAISIEVRSHTDSRQSHGYNLRLSDRRAQSTIKWMVAQGIDKSRLTGRGYGETQLANHCADGVVCSEAEHQQNRRSEFVVRGL